MELFKKILLLSTAFSCLGYEARGGEADKDENGKTVSTSLEFKVQQHSKSNSSSSEKQDPQTFSIKELRDLYYNDDDISDYIRLVLENGDNVYFNGCEHLLTSQQGSVVPIVDAGDNKPYLVAVFGAVDTLGLNNQRALGRGGNITSTNLDYFLDKSTRPKDVKEEVLEELIKFESTDPDLYYIELLQEIQVMRESKKYDLSFVEDLIKDVEVEDAEGRKIIQLRFQDELNKIKQQKKDVFDELMPPFLKVTEDSYAKILFPYNMTEWHWQTGEIRIHRQASTYAVQVYIHDPYGKGKMEDLRFSKIKESITKRIGEHHSVAHISIQNLESPYEQRQPKGDKISCGVVAAQDLLSLIRGPLSSCCCTVGATELRKSHLQAFDETYPEAPFIKRNKPKLDFISRYEDKLSDLDTLLAQLNQNKEAASLPPSQAKKVVNQSDTTTPLPTTVKSEEKNLEDTFEKIDEISCQITKIKEICKKIDSSQLQGNPLLEKIKESLFRISWRVDEIPSYDKFHMGGVFPEKNWVYLGYLSNVLNDSTINPQQLEVALYSLAIGIEEIEKALPVIKKSLEGKLKEEEKKRIQLHCLEEFVSFFMDKLFLKKIKNSIESIIYQKNAEDTEEFLRNEENRRAVFRVFEIMGEGTKYISEELKKLYPCVPWHPFSPDNKKNFLTIIRNKFHHDREKIELVFQYEKGLFNTILNTVFPYILQQITKVSEEYGAAYQSLNKEDFATLKSSALSKIPAKILAKNATLAPTTPSPEAITNDELSNVQKILKRITDIMLQQEDAITTLKGWAIKDLLSYIQKEDDSVYKFLFKITALPDTEDAFINFIRTKVKSPTDFIPDIEDKFRKAYSRLRGKKFSQKQIDEAFQLSPDVISPLSVSEIKEEIRRIILGGIPSNKKDFRERFLKPIFFKGMEQKKGEQKLEKRRARVSTDISPDKIEKLFELSEEDVQDVQKNSLKAFQESNKVNETLKDIARLPKNKVTKKDISKLIGLSNEDQKTLWEILEKAPAVNVESPEVRKKFSNLLTIKENIIKKLEGEETVIRNGKAIKIKITPHDLNNLIGLETEERNKIGRICGLQSSKRTNEQKENVFEILSKIPTTLEKYLEIPSEEQRTRTDIQTVEEILRKIPTTKENLKTLQQENAQKIKDILFKREICMPKAEQKAYFTLLADTLYYPKDVVNKIQEKFRKILFQSFDPERKLNLLLETIDDSISPLDYLRKIIENGWLLSREENDPKESVDKTQDDLQKLVKEVNSTWDGFKSLYEIKKDHSLTLEGIDKDIKKLEGIIKNLYEKKRAHILSLQDLEEDIKKLEGIINQLSELNNNSALSAKERKGNKKIIRKINALKEDIKHLPLLSKKSFQKLVEKAGYPYKGKFEELYQKIIFKGRDGPSLERLKKSLIDNIKKLDSVFEELSDKSLDPCKEPVLKMAAEYLIEEVGLHADALVDRKDYKECQYLSTSKRHLYLVSVCRKAMAHYPLEIEESLFGYLIDQLVLDTKLRLGHTQSDVEISAEEMKFEKKRKVTWKELEQKKIEIYAIVEGLGFKSDFKIFGKSLECDVSPQGDLNFLVERNDNGEMNRELHNLVELEARLSRELNCDVTVYTSINLDERLKFKVTLEHLQEIKDYATHTLEDIILGNTFVRIFQEDRWSSFRTPEGRIFTRSQFLEQQDLTTLFEFLLGRPFSFEKLENFLNDKEKLEEIVQEKLSLYNSSPEKHAPKLEGILMILSFLILSYETGFPCIYFPVERREGKICYEYYCSYRQIKSGKPLVDIQKGKKIFELLKEDITNLLCTKKKTILEKLSPKNIINEKNIFRALTVDYAFTQKELEEERHKLEVFQRKRLEDNPPLQKIIKNKSKKYCEALDKQFLSFSPLLKKYILEHVLLEKKVDELLYIIYKEHQAEITFLWRIMDEQQTKAFCHFMECASQGIFISNTQHVCDSFSIFKMNVKHTPGILKDTEKEAEINNILKRQEEIILDLAEELLKAQFPISWQSRLRVIRSGDRMEIEHYRSLRSHVNYPPISDSYLTVAEARRLVTKYTTMFFPIKNSQIIRMLLRENNPKDLINADFYDRYCQEEVPFTAFILKEGNKKEIGTMADFSSEIEYSNYERQKDSKNNLEELLTTESKTSGSNRHRKRLHKKGQRKKFPKKTPPHYFCKEPVKKLIEEGRGKELEQESTTLCGLGGEVLRIYKHASSLHHFAQRKSLTSTLEVEELPNFITRYPSYDVGIGLGSLIESKAMFSNDILDLNHLMQIYGWSEEDKEKYKVKHNFDEDNNIIKEYFSFARLSQALRSAKLREKAYNEKLADLQERQANHNKSYTPFQLKKLADDRGLYKVALEKNLESQGILKKKLIEHPHLQRKISEALRHPDFLDDLQQQLNAFHKKGQSLSNEAIENLITQKREELEAKALREIS